MIKKKKIMRNEIEEKCKNSFIDRNKKHKKINNLIVFDKITFTQNILEH